MIGPTQLQNDGYFIMLCTCAVQHILNELYRIPIISYSFSIEWQLFTNEPWSRIGRNTLTTFCRILFHKSALAQHLSTSAEVFSRLLACRFDHHHLTRSQPRNRFSSHIILTTDYWMSARLASILELISQLMSLEYFIQNKCTSNPHYDRQQLALMFSTHHIIMLRVDPWWVSKRLPW